MADLPQKGQERRHPVDGHVAAYWVASDGRVLYRGLNGLGECSARSWSALPKIVKAKAGAVGSVGTEGVG